MQRILPNVDQTIQEVIAIYVYCNFVSGLDGFCGDRNAPRISHNLFPSLTSLKDLRAGSLDEERRLFTYDPEISNQVSCIQEGRIFTHSSRAFSWDVADIVK